MIWEEVELTSLDLREADPERVLRNVTEVVVGRELEVVASLDLEQVGEEVGSLEGKVLDDEVDVGRGVLGTRNGNVTDLLEEFGENDGSDILPEVRLVLEVTFRVEEEVGEESLDGFSETLVESIVGVLSEEVLNLVEESILVSSVFAVLGIPELLARVLEFLSTTVTLILHDVSRFLEALTNVAVEFVEPVTKFGIVLRIGVELVNSVEDTVHGGTVGESLEESSELVLSALVVGVVTNRSNGSSGLLAGLLSLNLVVFSLVHEELDSLLVILVALFRVEGRKSQ